jgi:hypothetical protein
MKYSKGCAILIIFAAVSGCIGSDTKHQPVPVLSQVPVITATSPSGMALQPEDLPGDYSIRDRFAVPYESIRPLLLNLGWVAGYSSTFTRLNMSRGEYTTISQTISIYPQDITNMAYIIEKDAMLAHDNMTRRYEIPSPTVGNRSTAWRDSPQDERWGVATYTILFAKKNVIEKIAMTGTSTDYEELKEISRIAAFKIC